MSKGNTTSNASAMGYSNAASSASEKVPGEVRLANANAMGDASALSDSNALCAVSANAAGKTGVADALAAHEEDVAGANMADAAVSGGATSVANSADAEGPSSPTGASVPGNIARVYEALDSFWREQNQLYRDVATSFGISESAFDILYAIYLAGESGISQRDICVQMCIGKQTVNSSIHKLEREGVVVLESGPGRRGLLAHLTPVGLELAERNRPYDRGRACGAEGIRRQGARTGASSRTALHRCSALAFREYPWGAPDLAKQQGRASGWRSCAPRSQGCSARRRFRTSERRGCQARRGGRGCALGRVSFLSE